MKIGLFTDSFLPYISGVSISIETQAIGLRELGHEIFIFAPHYPGEDPDPYVFRFPSLPSLYPNFRVSLPFSKKIKEIIPKLGLDIIHSHSPFQMGRLAKNEAKKLKIPLVYTLHTLFEQYSHYVPLLPKTLKKKFVLSFADSFCGQCQAVIVPSEELAKDISQNGVHAPIKVVPTGINLGLADNFTGKGIREGLGIGAKAPLLIFCSRMAKEKNIPFLFAVFKLVLKEAPETKLLMVGGGPILGSLKSMVFSEGLGEKVIFVGEVPYPKVFDYYAAANIFIFASLTETQGLVIGEAKAKSLPVIALDSPGTRKSAQNDVDGWLLLPDKNLFSQKVIELIKTPQKQAQMGKAGREFVEKELSAKAMAKKIEAVYLGLKQLHSPGPVR